MRRSRKLLRHYCLTSLVVCLSLTSGFAQDKGKKEKSADKTFEMRLNVSVLDAEGRPVKDLRAEDFRISEDGAAQKVEHFSRAEGPPVFGIVADNSGSIRHLMDTVVDFGKVLVERSDAGSEAFVMRFISSEQITVLRDFTTNKRALVAALEEMYVEGGQTAITDALYVAAEHMAKRKDEGQPPRRRALVLITDGEDRFNLHRPENLLVKLREAGIQVYVLGLTKAVKLQGSPEKAIAYMKWLALETDGAFYLPEKNADLVEVAKEIIGEVNAPYAVGYTPANQKRDGSTRKLSVTVADGPNGEPRRVLARSSYTAPKK